MTCHICANPTCLGECEPRISRAIELAIELGMPAPSVEFYKEEFESFYQRAHRAGQEAMRERAADCVDPEFDGLVVVIRNLEIE